MRLTRVRPFVLAAVCVPVAGAALALSVSVADADPVFAATAAITGGPQYLGDSAGTVFTFTVTNTGTTTTIGAVEVERPSNGWSIASCGTAPTGWSAQKADPRCRYRSGETAADDILPGQSRSFSVTVTTLPGSVDRVGTWKVVVSRSNQFDQPSLLTAAEAVRGDLRTTAHAWEVVDAVVSDAAAAAGSACPPSDKDAQTSETVVMVVCGRNHATVPLTPAAGYSSLGGTFLAEPGTFSTGQIPAGSANVVVASWTGAKVRSTSGQNLTVVATVGSAANQTSPVTTLTGYEAINAPPVVADDAYSVAEDGSLTEPAPGVLGNDSDPEGQPVTAVLESGPAHAATFHLHADGSFDYAPAAGYAGADSFTYRASDGNQSSSPATVGITVTAVNDAPVNTAPGAVTTAEDTAYLFAPGALSVSDADSGAADVETTLTVADAGVTVGTSGVAVTGNGTGDVTVTGPVAAVAAALDGATLTPDADTNGATTLTIETSDLGHTGSGGALTDTDAVSVTVDAVNDAPSFTPGDDETVVEDAGARTVAGWATAISAGAADESAQALTFDVTTDDAALFATAPAVSPSGILTYTPAADASGSATVTVVLRDDGGTAGGGSDSSAPATFTITVTAVNDAPVNTAPASVSTNQGTAYVFEPGALSVSDVDSGAADVETRLTVAGATVTVGTVGVTVTGNGTGDVTVTGPVAAVAAAVDGATLTPTAGSTTLTIETSDLGHTGSGGVLTDTDTVSVSVVDLNDAPSFTPGADQTVAEDAGARSVPAWATAIDAGEPGQAVTFEVTNDNAALFAAAPAISPAGTLTYTAAPDAYGTATVTVVLRDDGGTANGGDDASDPVTFTITVNAVNDAPSAANHARGAQANMRITVTGLLAGASDTRDAGDPAYTPSFTLASVTPASCAGCGVSNVDPDGSFDFDPPAGGTGTYTLHYTVTDSGHPAPGVTSAAGTITVTVQGPVIWFVDPAAAGPGTGTLTDPFKALPSATAVAGTAGSRVFVASGAVTGSVSQPANSWLVGQGVSGASFDAVFGITPPAGTAARPAVNGARPTVTGSIGLGDGSVVRGLNLTPPAGTAGLVGSNDDGVTVGEVSVTSSGARAVDLRNSQGSTVSLTRVSASNAPSGIHLEDVNTTTPGSVAVTGDGSTAGSGGVVSGSTAAGVHLEDVANVSLAWLSVSGSAGEGVRASNAAGLTLSDSAVSGSGTHGVSVANSPGATTLTRVTASGSGADNARVFSSFGTSSLTVSGSTFRDTASGGGNGLLVQADGSAAMTFASTGSSYLRNRQDGLAVFAASSQRMTANVTNSTVLSDHGVGIDVVSSAPGGIAYSVSGGTVTGCATCGVPVNVYKATGATGTGANATAGTITGLTVSNGDSGNAPGIWVHAEGAGASRAAVTNNVVTAVGHIGIHVVAGNGSSTMDATVTGNTVTLGATGLQGVQVDSGTLSTDTTAVCAAISGNTALSPATSDVRVRNRQPGTTFRLPGYAGAATSTSSVSAFLIAQNTITDAAAVVGSSPGFAGGAACATP